MIRDGLLLRLKLLISSLLLYCQTEVPDLDNILGINEDVRWLEISVNDVLFMKMLDAFKDLREIPEVHASVKSLRSSLVNVILESLPWAELHLDHDINSEEVFTILHKMLNGRVTKSNALA